MRATVWIVMFAAACSGDAPPPPVSVDGAPGDDAVSTDGAASDAGADVDARAIDAAVDAVLADAGVDAAPVARTWQPATMVDDHGDAPELAIDPAGNVTVAWYRYQAAPPPDG